MSKFNVTNTRKEKCKKERKKEKKVDENEKQKKMLK